MHGHLHTHFKYFHSAKLKAEIPAFPVLSRTPVLLIRVTASALKKLCFSEHLEKTKRRQGILAL